MFTCVCHDPVGILDSKNRVRSFVLVLPPFTPLTEQAWEWRTTSLERVTRRCLTLASLTNQVLNRPSCFDCGHGGLGVSSVMAPPERQGEARQSSPLWGLALMELGIGGALGGWERGGHCAQPQLRELRFLSLGGSGLEFRS